MYSKDEAIILLMLETIDKIARYTGGLQNTKEFEADDKTFDATLMNFIALGEMISKLSDEFRDKHHHIEWSKIYAFRNVLAHDYFGILPSEVWIIIKKYLPKLKYELEVIVNQFNR